MACIYLPDKREEQKDLKSLLEIFNQTKRMNKTGCGE